MCVWGGGGGGWEKIIPIYQYFLSAGAGRWRREVWGSMFIKNHSYAGGGGGGGGTIIKQKIIPIYQYFFLSAREGGMGGSMFIIHHSYAGGEGRRGGYLLNTIAYFV